MNILDTAKSLSSSEIIPPPEMVGGLFPRGFVTVVASKPGTGKTWLTLIKAHTVVEDGGTVVIFNGESGLSLLQSRAQLLQYDFDAKPCYVYSLADCNDAGGLNLTDAVGWKNIQLVMNEHKPDVVFFDSLIAFCDCDDSDMVQMRSVFTRLAKLSAQYSCAIVANHHLRKSTSGDKKAIATMDDVIGSSAISRIACNVYTMTNEDDLVVVTCVKSWYKKPARFSFQLRGNDAGKIDVLSSVPAQVTPMLTRIEDYLERCGGWIDSTILRENMGITQVTYRTFARNMQKLITNGIAVRQEVGGANGRRVQFALTRLVDRTVPIGEP